MELTRQTKEQIKMLIECGISKTSIASEYDLSMDELEEVLNPKPKKIEPKNAKMSKSEYAEILRQKNRQKGIDTYNRLRPLVDNWDGTVSEFIAKYHIGISTYYKVKHANTVDEYLSVYSKKPKPAKENKPAKETSQDHRDARKETYETKKKSELPEPVVQERIEMPYTGRRADTHRPTKVTKEVFDNIKERFMNGETSRQLADDTKLGRGTISRIVRADNIDEYFSKRDADRLKYRKTKKTEISPELIELRAINDSLARIAEALEKKHKWFRR